MSCVDACKVCFQKYADFSGRARRSEFWGFCLANFLIELVLGLVSALLAGTGEAGALAGYALPSLYSLAVFLPSLAVTVRRLHDTDRSGAYILMSLIPLAGPIILLIAYCTESSLGENRYGPSPKGTRLAEPAAAVYQPPVQAAPAYRPAPLPETVYEPAETLPAQQTRGVSLRKEETRTLVCVEGELKGQRYTLHPGGVAVIGRDLKACNVALPANAPGVSRVHCKVSFDGMNAVITDLDSSYGTYVDGYKLNPGMPTTLHRGLAIDIGGRGNRFTLT